MVCFDIYLKHVVTPVSDFEESSHVSQIFTHLNYCLKMPKIYIYYTSLYSQENE